MTVVAPLPPTNPLPERARRRRPPGLLVATALVLAALFALPLLYLIVRTIGFGADALDVLESDDALGPLTRTLLLATSMAIACAVLGTGLAWLVTRTDLPGRRVLRVLLVLPLVIPSFVGAFALQAAFAPNGLIDGFVGFATPPRIEGFWGALTVLVLLSYPYVYLPVAARLSTLPASLEESGRSLGRSPAAVFRTVVLPQASGSIAAGTLLVFLYGVSEFGAVSLMRYDTLTLRIDSTRLLDPTTSITLSLLLAVVALIVVVSERAVGRRRAPVEAVGAGRQPLQTKLGRWKFPACIAAGGVVAVALIAPVAVLVQWSWRGLAGNRFAGPSSDVSTLVTPAVNTTLIALVTALIATVVILPIAYLTVRHRARVGGAVNAVVVSGFALPGLVIALALVFFVLGSQVVGGLYQTYTLLVFAYLVHFGAQSLRSSQVAVGGLPLRVEDAARSLGAGRIRRFVTIELPLALPAVAAGAGLVLMSVMKELPATLLLAPTGFDTLATKVWSASESGFLGQAGLASLMLVALSAILTWILVVRRMDRVNA